MRNQNLRKAGRLKRLWPGRIVTPPATPPSCREADHTEPFPPRSLTAAELIAMARQARAVADARDPTESAGVF